MLMEYFQSDVLSMHYAYDGDFSVVNVWCNGGMIRIHVQPFS